MTSEPQVILGNFYAVYKGRVPGIYETWYVQVTC